ncbi:DUF7426 family protein, partial [Streptomyces sp. NPDC000941]
MAARFEALDELFDDALELPIRGKTYRIPSPTAEDGLKVQRITTLAARLVAGGEAIDTNLLDDDEERDLFQLCLGPVFEELRADGVTWSQLRHTGLTAMFWIVSGVETAEQYWKAAGDPSQLAPNRETRRAQKKSGSAAASATK